MEQQCNSPPASIYCPLIYTHIYFRCILFSVIPILAILAEVQLGNDKHRVNFFSSAYVAVYKLMHKHKPNYPEGGEKKKANIFFRAEVKNSSQCKLVAARS